MKAVFTDQSEKLGREDVGVSFGPLKRTKVE